jgi:hypothetical protein
MGLHAYDHKKRRGVMPKKKFLSLLVLSLMMCLPFGHFGCVTPADKQPVVTPFSGIAKGYSFELGEFKGGSFETPEYIPTRMRFEMEQNLRQRDLLAAPSQTEKRLIVNVTTTAVYAGNRHLNRCAECYMRLVSHVTVLDPQKAVIMAEKEFVIYNSGSGIINIAYFTEITHAKDISNFLESMVH